MHIIKVNNIFFLAKVGCASGKGPLLYIIFLNNMLQAINHSDFFLYCEDLKILRTKSPENKDCSNASWDRHISLKLAKPNSPLNFCKREELASVCFHGKILFYISLLPSVLYE